MKSPQEPDPERSEKLSHDKAVLPEWIDLGDINVCDCSDCPYVIHLHEALAIAWEALKDAEERCTHAQSNYRRFIRDDKSAQTDFNGFCEGIRWIVKDAMRRIAQLGDVSQGEEIDNDRREKAGGVTYRRR